MSEVGDLIKRADAVMDYFEKYPSRAEQQLQAAAERVSVGMISAHLKGGAQNNGTGHLDTPYNSLPDALEPVISGKIAFLKMLTHEQSAESPLRVREIIDASGKSVVLTRHNDTEQASLYLDGILRGDGASQCAGLSANYGKVSLAMSGIGVNTGNLAEGADRYFSSMGGLLSRGFGAGGQHFRMEFAFSNAEMTLNAHPLIIAHGTPVSVTLSTAEIVATRKAPLVTGGAVTIITRGGVGITNANGEQSLQFQDLMPAGTQFVLQQAGGLRQTLEGTWEPNDE